LLPEDSLVSPDQGHTGDDCERPIKGNKAIEREVIASYQIAQGMGFRGDFRQWEHLMRVHE
jgi:hypothetical protein